MYCRYNSSVLCKWAYNYDLPPPTTIPDPLKNIITEKFISVDGCRVRYLQAGAGPPLILVHGLLGYAFSWRFNIAALSQRATVYALDLPGTGFSGRVPKQGAGLHATAEQLIGFMQAIGIRSATLLGSSQGGAIVMVAAIRAAENGISIHKLILSSPVNPWSLQGTYLASVLGKAWGAGCFRLLAPCLWPMHRYFLARMYGDVSRIAPGTVEGYRKPLAVPGTLNHLLGRVEHWAEELKALEHTISNLPKIPVLLIWGSHDRAVYLTSANELLARIPQARLVTIESAGHLPYEEMPEEFNRAVLEFLRAT